MNSLQIADYLDTLSSFKEMVTKQLGDDARFFLVLAKDGMGKSLEANNDGALIQQFTSLVEDGQWSPLGIFAASLGGLDNEFGGALMKTGMEAIRIERFCFQEPPSHEDAQVFAEVIAAEVKRFSSGVAPR
jgi:hypothetical protein